MILSGVSKLYYRLSEKNTFFFILGVMLVFSVKLILTDYRELPRIVPEISVATELVDGHILYGDEIEYWKNSRNFELIVNYYDYKHVLQHNPGYLLLVHVFDNIPTLFLFQNLLIMLTIILVYHYLSPQAGWLLLNYFPLYLAGFLLIKTAITAFILTSAYIWLSRPNRRWWLWGPAIGISYMGLFSSFIGFNIARDGFGPWTELSQFFGPIMNLSGFYFSPIYTILGVLIWLGALALIAYYGIKRLTTFEKMFLLGIVYMPMLFYGDAGHRLALDPILIGLAYSLPERFKNEDSV